jgi:type I restriction enzyme M protein
MQEEYKRKIEQQLYPIAELLRAKMPTVECQNYILGLVFFKVLSDRVECYANNWLEKKELFMRVLMKTARKGKST